MCVHVHIWNARLVLMLGRLSNPPVPPPRTQHRQEDSQGKAQQIIKKEEPISESEQQQTKVASVSRLIAERTAFPSPPSPQS